MGFKEQIVDDIQQIAESNEFFSVHNLDGEELLIMIDDEELSEREKLKAYHTDGIYISKKLFYVTKKDYAKELPIVGSAMNLDDEFFLVADSAEQDGLYIITLGVNAT